MNVTTEINNKRNSMGGSGSSRQAYLAANRSLNLSAAGNNINTAAPKLVTAIPAIINAQDSVGLFGPENKFIKLDLEIKSTSYYAQDAIENTYYPAQRTAGPELENDYYGAVMDFLLDPVSVNLYQPARASSDLSSYSRPVVSVSLINNKTGNRFVDDWLDVRLYGPNKEPIDEMKIYTDFNSDIFLGFHARNTKRLPYNVTVEVGVEYLEYQDMTNAQRAVFY